MIGSLGWSCFCVPTIGRFFTTLKTLTNDPPIVGCGGGGTQCFSGINSNDELLIAAHHGSHQHDSSRFRELWDTGLYQWRIFDKCPSYDDPDGSTPENARATELASISGDTGDDDYSIIVGDEHDPNHSYITLNLANLADLSFKTQTATP